MVRRALVGCILVLSFWMTDVHAQVVATPKQGPEPKSAPKTKVAIYNEHADAKADIAKAVAKARKENRRVLVQWGANWCSWCRLLHNTCTANAEVRRELQFEYDVVLVDVGKFDKYKDLQKQLRADLSKHGVPFLTVLDGDGRVLANQETGSLELPKEKAKEPGHDVPKLLAFLKQHEAKRLNANDVLGAALKESKRSDRRVFVHFGAPWCGWCHRLEDWLAKPEIAAAISKDYVDVKIDQDRMADGKELLNKYCAKPGGIPWYAILSPDGKALATSDAADGNVGYPAEDKEIAHLISMLAKTKNRLTEADLALLKNSLEREGAQYRRPQPKPVAAARR